MGSFDEYPPHLRALLEKVAEAGYRDILLDEEAGNRFLYDTMASSSDPTLREIGEQLRDGALDMRQLAASDYYRETLNGGLANLATLDPEQMAEDLDRALAGQEAATAEDDSADEHREREDTPPGRDRS
ncbi:hypothetical protein [Krasilnikovia sp. M28-CT-15]|uniref:hypothetical protein n=1 Tax=Krasilnikovia sp. M28-CT-15 TaxID=3373540 RepID=UPI0038776287